MDVEVSRAERLQLALGRARASLQRLPDQPLISICIPTYNRGELLAGRTLPSILAQTYERFEVVIVGDGCTDDTGSRLAALGDPRIRFENLPARGVYPEDPFLRWLVAGTPAANRTIEKARGEWLAYSDDDDVWTPDHLAVLLEHARSTNVEFVYGAAEFQRSAEEWIRIGALPPKGGHIAHSSILYRAYLRFMKYDIRACDVKMAGDAHLWARMHRLGVSFSFLDRVVCSAPLRPDRAIAGMNAALAEQKAWQDKS